jgi:hypothetical protein
MEPRKRPSHTPKRGPGPAAPHRNSPAVPTHDLLVMSHSPDAMPGDRSNHACLNSFASSSWIIASGGRPKTIVGR